MLRWESTVAHRGYLRWALWSDYLDIAVVSHNAGGRVMNDAASGVNVAIERDDDVGADRRSERPTGASELVNIQRARHCVNPFVRAH